MASLHRVHPEWYYGIDDAIEKYSRSICFELMPLDIFRSEIIDDLDHYYDDDDPHIPDYDSLVIDMAKFYDMWLDN